MSTNSAISMKLDNGQLKAVYCHWDGYPSHNGMLLKRYYNTKEKVEELLTFGDISSLADCVENCEFYHRDRGEKLIISQLANLEIFHSLYYLSGKFSTAEYIYVFDHEEWKCYTDDGEEVSPEEWENI